MVAAKLVGEVAPDVEYSPLSPVPSIVKPEVAVVISQGAPAPAHVATAKYPELSVRLVEVETLVPPQFPDAPVAVIVVPLTDAWTSYIPTEHISATPILSAIVIVSVPPVVIGAYSNSVWVAPEVKKSSTTVKWFE